MRKQTQNKPNFILQISVFKRPNSESTARRAPERDALWYFAGGWLREAIYLDFR